MVFDPLSAFLGWLSKKGLDAAWNRTHATLFGPNPRPILILGPGGVGKTTLGTALADPAHRSDGQYTESISTEKFSLDGYKKVEVVVLPGQKRHIASTWTTVLEDLTAGVYRGVILIQAYGYHAMGDFSYINHRLYSAETGLSGFLNAYFADCREEEEAILQLVCDNIRQCSKPIWLLTLVTKQDLWWGERNDVEKYYRTGDYEHIISECMGGKSPHHFRYETVFTSLVMRNLLTGRDELLKPIATGYDQALQYDSFETLKRVFDGLVRWEEQYAKKP